MLGRFRSSLRKESEDLGMVTHHLIILAVIACTGYKGMFAGAVVGVDKESNR